MEELGCPRRQSPARMTIWLFATSVVVCVAEPTTVNSRWLVTYPPAVNGKASESTAVAMSDGALIVSVVSTGADAAKPTLYLGNRKVTTQFLGFDPVSRLGFLKPEASPAPKSCEWLEEAGGSTGSTLQAMTPGGSVKCRASGWVKQVGGKILPLALLRVNFDGPVPPRGTPLTDSAGKVAAIVFQESGSDNSGYAIPAEAVHRVKRDVCNGGHLVRGWIGLSLRAENQSPQIVRVLPDSPAAAAGIKPGDLLLKVGDRQISDYADVANAFFYLIPGKPVAVKLKRGNDSLEFTLTPTRPKAE